MDVKFKFSKWCFNTRFGDHFRVGDHFGVGFLSGELYSTRLQASSGNSDSASLRSKRFELIPFLFCSRPNFSRRTRAETLATQARIARTGLKLS